MSKLKNIKPSKLFVIVAITVFVAGGINIVLGNYMTAAWCAFVAILELVIANLCKECEYWQQRAFDVLELGSKIQDENENLLANLRTAKEVLTATIIDRDNANAEIAKLKQEVEQLRIVKINGN
jgi:hypothetical protein